MLALEVTECVTDFQTRNSAPRAADFSHSQFSSDLGWAYLVLILLGSHAYLGLG
jgi:hypothetical protein